MGAEQPEGTKTQWQRSILLVLAITLHNIPEGLAVGVAFGAVAHGIEGATIGAALALAVGIGLQNFPEGTAVGLLATAAAGQARVFHDKLPAYQLLIPEEGVHREMVAGAILQVKLEDRVEEPREKLLAAVDTLQPQPAAVIAGCTEVELALAQAEAPFRVILPMDLLAQEIVARAWEG